MNPVWVSFIAACTALAASIGATVVTLAVSSRQFRANVLSGNRQKWITTLREMTSELISLAAATHHVKAGMAGEWNAGRVALAADPASIAKLERIVLVRWNIRLLLNPTEPEHAALIRAIDAVVEDLRSERADDDAARAGAEAVAAAAQVVIRRAWQRVKRGT